MGQVGVDELLGRGDSIYKLVLLASRRAIELGSGAPKLVDSGARKVSTVAIDEIAAGKVRYVVDGEEQGDG